MANCCIKGCRTVKHFPTRVMCVLAFMLQAGIVNYYLVEYKDRTWLSFLVADIVCLCLFIAAFVISYKYLSYDKGSTDKTLKRSWIGVIAWFVYSVLVAVKAGIIFMDIAYQLEEKTFFGPNTLKTTLAFTGVVFLLYLSSLHDAKPGSPRRTYIDELTGTVIFDIMDCVDSMEPLFVKEDRDAFPPGLEEAIVTIACINFVLPTIPFLTLTNTVFGHKNLPRRLVMLHKIGLAFLINLPLLIMRMILWHGLNNGISIFSLKNVIVIAVVSYDFYEHYEAVHSDETTKISPIELHTKNQNEADEVKADDYAMEDRFNYTEPL